MDFDNKLITGCLDIVPSPVIISNVSDGTIIYANQAAAVNLLGFKSQKDAIGKKTTDTHVWEDIKDRQHVQTELITKGTIKDFQTVFLTPDGNRHIYSFTAKKWPKKDIMISFGTEITDKLKKEEMINDNTKNYIELIDATETSYVILSEECEIIDANERFADLIGCDNQECLIGKSPRAWMTSDTVKLFDSSWRKVLQGDSIEDTEIAFNKNGHSSYLRISQGLIRNGGKKIIWLARDMTQEKTEELTNYIRSQKKKDKIRQEIMAIRQQLNNFTKRN